MADTLPGVQVTNRCAWVIDRQRLCGQPAPYLIDGYSYCPDHAAEVLTDT